MNEKSIYKKGVTNKKFLRHLGSQMPSSSRITNFEERSSSLDTIYYVSCVRTKI